MWYKYVPTFTGEARFQTCGSTFATTLQLHNDCGGAILACNDDVGARGLVGVTCTSNRSLISRFAVTTGVPVYVRIGATGTPFANAATSGALTISVAPPLPPNDLCEGAMSVAIGTWNATTPSPSANFNLAEATDDYNIGVDFCSAGTTTASTRDVWFRLTSACGGTYTIDTCGSTMTNPMLHVFDVCNGAVIACHDNVGSGVAGCTSNQARISNLAITGDVMIRVSSSGTGAPTSGSFQLVITGTEVSCGTADFDNDGDTGTDLDIEAFFACLGGDCCGTCGSADFDCDGDTGTDLDIEAFFFILGGGGAC